MNLTLDAAIEVDKSSRGKSNITGWKMRTLREISECLPATLFLLPAWRGRRRRSPREVKIVY